MAQGAMPHHVTVRDASQGVPGSRSNRGRHRRPMGTSPQVRTRINLLIYASSGCPLARRATAGKTVAVMILGAASVAA